MLELPLEHRSSVTNKVINSENITPLFIISALHSAPKCPLDVSQRRWFVATMTVRCRKIDPATVRMFCVELFSFPRSPQKPGQGPSVPDLSRLHPRHTHRRGPLPAAEEGPEPTDDRRVPRQQQEAVQQRRPGVSSAERRKGLSCWSRGLVAVSQLCTSVKRRLYVRAWNSFLTC